MTIPAHLSTLPRCWAVIPAAGIGSRMQRALPKQYMLLHQQPVICHSINTFMQAVCVAGIVVAIAADDGYWLKIQQQYQQIGDSKPLWQVNGGVLRVHSVISALAWLLEQPQVQPHDWVLVHDAARPGLTVADIYRLVGALQNHEVGGLLALPVADTLKQVDIEHCVRGTLSRAGVMQAQTPQMFRLRSLYEALCQAEQCGAVVTDEASAMEQIGYAPQCVLGHLRNLKLTTMDDHAVLSALLSNQYGGDYGDVDLTSLDFYVTKKTD